MDRSVMKAMIRIWAPQSGQQSKKSFMNAGEQRRPGVTSCATVDGFGGRTEDGHHLPAGEVAGRRGNEVVFRPEG